MMLRILVFKKRTLYIALAILAVIAIAVSLFFAMTGSDETFSETMKYAYKKISPEQAKVLIEKNPDLIIFDVRSEKDYNTGHIPSALQVTERELKKNMAYYERDNLYMIYANDTKNSEDAAETLASNGFSRIYMLNGGLENWPYELE